MPDAGAPTLRESQWKPLALTDAQADAAAALGRALAGQATWWGNAGQPSTDPAGQGTSAIHVRRARHGGWEVRVVDAIGVIRVGGTVIPVHPKVPGDHVLALLTEGGVLPRVATASVDVGTGDHLFELVARWLVSASEDVLRGDLIREYRAHDDTLGHVRGRIDVQATSLRLLAGRAEVLCEYDELDVDNAINRVLLAAVRLVTRSSLAQPDTRSRANRLIGHFDGVTAVRPADVAVEVGPRTWYYRQALSLAKLVLSGSSLDLDAGDTPASAFLLRTPEPVEGGIRNLLARRLQGKYLVTNKNLLLPPSTKTLNPDLVFDRGLAVGDVKYQLQGGDWDSAHLYQAVTFATGYRARHALVITFSTGPAARPSLQVGDVTLTNLCWNAGPGVTYADAANTLVDEVGRWLADQRQVAAPNRLATG
ncbi:McrC family protein [Nocardioides abyssi]|uniref:Restriction endonuclease n=1 Tax=Nocardioides abyssi TaxID=3058370 RepID=A0ABT8EZB2_9ACTN|nr:hypothetical protein [Nocardioides abyssi]MDN4163359.1 hypothetical protein [Nocardioides abyssi]